MSDKWQYTLYKSESMWYWSLYTHEGSGSAWTGAAWSKRGSLRAMRKIKKNAEKREVTKETGTI